MKASCRDIEDILIEAESWLFVEDIINRLILSRLEAKTRPICEKLHDMVNAKRKKRIVREWRMTNGKMRWAYRHTLHVGINNDVGKLDKNLLTNREYAENGQLPAGHL